MLAGEKKIMPVLLLQLPFFAHVFVVVAELEVDGRPATAGSPCSAACGNAVSLLCTVSNCSRRQLTGVTVALASVGVTASSFDSYDRCEAAMVDDSVVVVGCLTSTFPQVGSLLLLAAWLSV